MVTTTLYHTDIYRLTCNGIPTQHLQLPTPEKQKRNDEADSLLCHPKANCTCHTHHNVDKCRHQKCPEQHVTPYLCKRDLPSCTCTHSKRTRMESQIHYKFIILVCSYLWHFPTGSLGTAWQSPCLCLFVYFCPPKVNPKIAKRQNSLVELSAQI